MALVMHLPDALDPSVRKHIELRKPVTIRRLLRRRELRAFTSVRTVGGPHGSKRRVREFKRATLCQFNGKPLLRRDWSRTIVRATDVVIFQTLPAGGGGGGGGGGKNIIGIVLAVAIAVAAPYLAGPGLLGLTAGTLTHSLATAGIGMALSAVAYGLMSLLVTPPPMSALPPGSSASAAAPAEVSPTYNLSVQGNVARLGQPKPRLYGKHVCFPDIIMPPYERFVGHELYISTLLAVTLGSCEIHQQRIGETPTSSFEEITIEKVEPGATVPSAIVDTRFLPCRDISATTLPGAEASSPWKGPFIANPPGTLINHFEINLVAQRGLYAYNTSSGGLLSKSVSVEIQAQEIDDEGTALGSWTAIDTFNATDTTQRARRWTMGYDTPSAGRWQVRLRRTDTQDLSTTVGHEIAWTALRGRLLSARTYAGMTLLAVKMKATGDLNSQTSRQVNVIATSKLRTWDPALNGGAGGMTTGLVETRSIPDVLADMLLADYGGRGTAATVDLPGIYAHKAALDALGWTYDAVHDTSSTVWEATGRVARAAIGERVWQGGKVRLVRDVAPTAPVMMFSPRNMRPQSLSIDYKMVDGQTADAFVGVYVEPNAWKPATLTYAFDDSPQDNPVTMQLEGVTNREQAWAMLVYFARVNRYRRKLPGFGTEMDGLVLFYGDPVSISHDVPQWGQFAEAVAWDAGTRTLTLTEEFVWTDGESHYVALNKADGTLAGPYAATPGPAADQVVLGAGELPPIRVGGTAERTHVQFGIGEAYGLRAKTIAVQPRDELTADIVTVIDDPRVYDELPEIPETPIGVPTDPITIHITSSTSNVTLRALANAANYSGLAVQPVTIYVDAGVEVTTMLRGTWPAGYVLKLIVNGTISGLAGAAGGAGLGGTVNTFVGDPGNGQAGGAGGTGTTALNVASGPIEIGGTGTIRGGPGGGGGGGGGGGIQYDWMLDMGELGQVPQQTNRTGGAGGAGNSGAGAAGSDDGKSITGSGGNGGAAGGWGAPGSAGAAGTAGSVYDGTVTNPQAGSGGAGGAGGAAGKSIQGIGNVTWTPGHSVTLQGPTA